MPDQLEPWTVLITPRATRELRRLSADDRSRVSAIVASFEAGPPRGIKKLSGRDAQWRVRVGDVRVVFEIEYSERLIAVTHILPRGRAYRD